MLGAGDWPSRFGRVGILGIEFLFLQDRAKSGTVSKVQWANGLKVVLNLDVPFLSYVVSYQISHKPDHVLPSPSGAIYRRVSRKLRF